MGRPERQRDTLNLAQLLPSLITILGLCAGLSAIRYVFVERFEIAVMLIIFAALIDGLDGLLARRLEATSTMGAELDTLSDFVNFGVAPGLLVFQYALVDLRGLGWVFVLVYVICCCLRLARFNVNRDRPTPGRAHFIGVPAPAGALLAMLPVYLGIEGAFAPSELPLPVAIYLGVVGFLMVSRLPTFSPKSFRVRREHAIWVLLGTAIVVGLMLTRLWLFMIVADLIYLVALAIGAGRRTARRARETS